MSLESVAVVIEPTWTEVVFFFFNDTATTEIYTLSLHDALPIRQLGRDRRLRLGATEQEDPVQRAQRVLGGRSEEHTSELQSPDHLVCRLLLEKKKKQARTLDVGQQKKRTKP